MKRLIGKSLGNVVFTEQNGNLYGNLTNYGVNASYLIKPVDFCGPAKAILMDLDGTTLTSEEFWVFVIEQTMQKMLGDDKFALEDADIPLRGGRRAIEALRYGFIDMMQDIGRWLVLGLLVAGLITILVPDDFFASFADRPLLNMFIVLLFSIPMYLCATGSIPIAAALMLKGLSPGAALVLLMAGPATNMASILVIGKVMGRRTLVAYLASIIIGAIGFGLVIDYLLPAAWFVPAASVHAACHGQGGYSWLEIASSVVLVALLIYALVRRYTSKTEKNMTRQKPTLFSISALIRMLMMKRFRRL